MVGYAFFIPSKSSLAARRSSIICTAILVPFIHGFPLHIFGSITIFSIALFILQNFFLFVFYVNSHTGLTIEMLQFDFASGDKNGCHCYSKHFILSIISSWDGRYFFSSRGSFSVTL